MVLIRSATQDDVAALAAMNVFVHQLHAEAEPWFFKQTGPEFLAARAQAFGVALTNADNTIWVAEVGGSKLVGYLWASRRDNAESAELFACQRLWINHISVHPDYCRQGIGEALMGAAKALAKQRGANLSLSVHAFNLRAQQFFAKQGFAPLIHTMWLSNSREAVSHEP